MFQTEKLKLKYRLKALFDGLNQQVAMITCYKFRFLSITGLLFFGLCIFALGWFAQSKSFQMLQIHGVEYLGAPSVGQGGVVSVKEIKSPHELNSMDISFEFMTQEPTFSYGNLFQTADSINAIRMELQPSSNLVLVLGSSNVFPLSSSIQIGKYYDVRLTYEREHFFKVFVDKKEVLNVTDKKLLAGGFDISNIVVGTGLAKQRMLVGEVKNFNLNGTYSYLNRIGSLSRWLLVVMGVLTSIRLSKLIWTKIAIKLSAPTLLMPLDNQEKIIFTATIVGIGGMSWIVFYYITHVFFLPQEMPMTFHYPVNMFCDFFRNFDLQARMGLSSTSNYFPFSAIFFGLFGWIGEGSSYRAVAFSLATGSVIMIWLTWLYFRTVLKSGALLCAFVVSMMSYPFLFTMHTGNLEIWVFIFICMFFLSYNAGHRALSTGFLAAAIAMKLYPAIFIVMFVIDKRYRLVLYTSAWVVALTLLPFLIWPTDLDIYLSAFLEGMRFYKYLMIESYSGVYFGHSLINSLRALWPGLQSDLLFPAYYLFAGIVLILMTIYATLIEKVLWKKVAVLVIALCLLPPTSTEYKLLYFFIPFFFFVNHDVKSKSDALHTFLFGLLFINKGYIYFHGDQYVTLNGIANTVIMIAMFIVILVEHFLGLWSKIVFKHEKCERIHNGWSSSRPGNLVKR